METHGTLWNSQKCGYKVATKPDGFSLRARSVIHPPVRLAERAIAIRRVDAEQPPVLHVREDAPAHQRRDRPGAALEMRSDLALGLPVFRSCAFGGAVHRENVFGGFEGMFTVESEAAQRIWLLDVEHRQKFDSDARTGSPRSI